MSTLAPVTAFANAEFALDVIPAGDSFHVLAPSCARSLGFRDAFRLMESIPEAEKGYTTACTPGGEQRVGYLTEAGFYRALGQRQAARITDDNLREQVERFQSWVYGDVLPSIRKRGGYLTPDAAEAALTDPDFIIRLATDLKAERARRAELEQTVDQQRGRLRLVEPKANAFDRWLSSNGDWSNDLVAKGLMALGVKTGRNRLIEAMGTPRSEGGIGWTFKQGRYWHAYQSQIENGRLRMKLGSHENSKTGEVDSHATVRITAKGAAALAVHYGVLPEDLMKQLDAQEEAA